MIITITAEKTSIIEEINIVSIYKEFVFEMESSIEAFYLSTPF